MNMKSRFATACAVLATACVGYGELSVKFNSAMEVEIDGEVRSFKNGSVWTDPEKGIYRMRPVLATGERTFGIEGNASTAMHYFPQYGEGNWVRVSLAGDEQVTLTGYKASKIYYADAEHGNDDWDGTTDYKHRDETASPKKGPKKTLQAACDGAASGSSSSGFPIVLVAPGVYKEGGTTTYYRSTDKSITTVESEDTSNSCKRRLYATKSIGIIAIEGAEQTFIVGAPDDPLTSKRKGENAVGGVLLNPAGRAFLQGFTITGCYSPETQSAWNQYGTAFSTSASRAYMLDCIVSNNVATKYPVSWSGVIMRTKILENEAHQYISQYGNFVSCVFAGNRITIGNQNTSGYALTQDGALRFCTVDLTSDGNASNGRKRLHDATKLYGVLAYGLTENTIDANWFCSLATDAPQFADVSARDYRLEMQSPAMDYVDWSTLDDATRKRLTSDIEGRMPNLHDGKMPCGAYWRNEPEIRYVDCVNGDDSNDGLSLAKAKKTIGAAMAEAVRGDTIRVEEGSYGTQEGMQTAGSKGFSRVVVREGVTLESIKGADKTFIVGADATGDQVDNATYGTGTNAVRCVYAKSGAVVRGFTLTGGRGVGTGDYSGRGHGSAFYSETSGTATISDCIVSNNAAWKGTVYGAVMRNCRVFENVGIEDSGSGAGCLNSYVYGSIFDRNRGNGTVYYPYSFVNCTIGRNNYRLAGTSNPQTLSWYASRDRSIANCAILGNGRLYFGGGGKLVCTNCVIVDSNSSWADKLRSESSLNTIFTNTAAMQVDAEYCPVFGSFVGIDAGDASVVLSEFGGTDVYGSQRIMNGAIDVGAVEYDWRPKFGSELGRRFTVTYASSSVKTNSIGGVKLDGMTSGLGDFAHPVCIAGTVNEVGMYEVFFNVTGGTLAVYVGEDEVATGSAGQEGQSVQFKVADTSSEIRIVFTPAEENSGYAILQRLSLMRGFTITIR